MRYFQFECKVKNMNKSRGWPGEKQRHSMSARGIETKRKDMSARQKGPKILAFMINDTLMNFYPVTEMVLSEMVDEEQIEYARNHPGPKILIETGVEGLDDEYLFYDGKYFYTTIWVGPGRNMDVVERSSGFWVVGEHGPIVSEPFDTYQDAQHYIDLRS